MTTFVCLTTDDDKKPVWINLDRVVRIKPHGAGSWLDLEDNLLWASVLETPEQILQKLSPEDRRRK